MSDAEYEYNEDAAYEEYEEPDDSDTVFPPSKRACVPCRAAPPSPPLMCAYACTGVAGALARQV